jgi:hypothetical protein
VRLGGDDLPDAQSFGEMRFGAGGERSRLLMSHVKPPRVPSPADCIRDDIEPVACDSIDSLDSRYSEGPDPASRLRCSP